uniref:Uncharacterized protein n=1 Tax=Caenorhabditis japonica TaxID=281687 RepID=A0A8R1EKZ5_CAEJA
MAKKRVRLVGKTIVHRIAKQINTRHGSDLENGSEATVVNNSSSISEVEDKYMFANLDTETDTNDDCHLSIKKSLARREKMWQQLSDQDLRRALYLLSTTQSKSAMSEFFDCESVEKTQLMKDVLFDTSNYTTVLACAHCSLDLKM